MSNINLEINETKSFNVALYDKVTNLKVADAAIEIAAITNSNTGAAQTSFTGTTVSIVGKTAGSTNINVMANVTYTNSFGLQTTETNKLLPATIVVGTPNETELRFE